MNKVNSIIFDVFVGELNIAKLNNVANMVIRFKNNFDNIIQSRKIALFKIVDIIIGNQHQINNDLIMNLNILTARNIELENRIIFLEHQVYSNRQLFIF